MLLATTPETLAQKEKIYAQIQAQYSHSKLAKVNSLHQVHLQNPSAIIEAVKYVTSSSQPI